MLKKFGVIALIFGFGFGVMSCTKKDEVIISPEATKNLQDADNFLAQNQTQTGVMTTKSGLQYIVINKGNSSAKSPSYDSMVRVNYEGKLANGKVFDSSYERGVAAEFPVSQLIPAWTEALQLMHPGDEWTIWVHPKLGYGSMGMPMGCGSADRPCEIPPNSLLIFKMRLESIVGADSVGGEVGNEIVNSIDGKIPEGEIKNH